MAHTASPAVFYAHHNNVEYEESDGEDKTSYDNNRAPLINRHISTKVTQPSLFGRLARALKPRKKTAIAWSDANVVHEYERYDTGTWPERRAEPTQSNHRPEAIPNASTASTHAAAAATATESSPQRGGRRVVKMVKKKKKPALPPSETGSGAGSGRGAQGSRTGRRQVPPTQARPSDDDTDSSPSSVSSSESESSETESDSEDRALPPHRDDTDAMETFRQHFYIALQRQDDATVLAQLHDTIGWNPPFTYDLRLHGQIRASLERSLRNALMQPHGREQEALVHRIQTVVHQFAFAAAHPPSVRAASDTAASVLPLTLALDDEWGRRVDPAYLHNLRCFGLPLQPSPTSAPVPPAQHCIRLVPTLEWIVHQWAQAPDPRVVDAEILAHNPPFWPHRPALNASVRAARAEIDAVLYALNTARCSMPDRVRFVQRLIDAGWVQPHRLESVARWCIEKRMPEALDAVLQHLEARKPPIAQWREQVSYLLMRCIDDNIMTPECVMPLLRRCNVNSVYIPGQVFLGDTRVFGNADHWTQMIGTPLIPRSSVWRFPTTTTTSATASGTAAAVQPAAQLLFMMLYMTASLRSFVDYVFKHPEFDVNFNPLCLDLPVVLEATGAVRTETGGVSKSSTTTAGKTTAGRKPRGGSGNNTGGNDGSEHNGNGSGNGGGGSGSSTLEPTTALNVAIATPMARMRVARDDSRCDLLLTRTDCLVSTGDNALLRHSLQKGDPLFARKLLRHPSFMWTPSSASLRATCKETIGESAPVTAPPAGVGAGTNTAATAAQMSSVLLIDLDPLSLSSSDTLAAAPAIATIPPATVAAFSTLSATPIAPPAAAYAELHTAAAPSRPAAAAPVVERRAPATVVTEEWCRAHPTVTVDTTSRPDSMYPRIVDPLTPEARQERIRQQTAAMEAAAAAYRHSHEREMARANPASTAAPVEALPKTHPAARFELSDTSLAALRQRLNEITIDAPMSTNVTAVAPAATTVTATATGYRGHQYETRHERTGVVVEDTTAESASPSITRWESIQWPRVPASAAAETIASPPITGPAARRALAPPTALLA